MFQDLDEFAAFLLAINSPEYQARLARLERDAAAELGFPAPAPRRSPAAALADLHEEAFREARARLVAGNAGGTVYAPPPDRPIPLWQAPTLDDAIGGIDENAAASLRDLLGIAPAAQPQTPTEGTPEQPAE